LGSLGKVRTMDMAILPNSTKNLAGKQAKFCCF
jgi:hypothetical protein